MTRAQANALMVALVGQTMPASAVVSFPGGGVESWQVQLDATHVYTGAQLANLAAYCAQNGLTLSAQVSNMGVT